MGRAAAGAQWARGRSLALFLVAASGCGHAATSTQPPPAKAAPDQRGPFSATLAWWPSQLPDSPSIWLHVKAPAVDLPRLAKFAPPGAERDLRDPARLATMALGSRIAGLVDLQGPLDLLTSPAPASLFTLAFSVSGPAAVKDAAAAGWLRPLGPARWALSGPGGGRPGMSCQVWHLAAPVGFRILCGNDPSALDRDGALLLGRLARRPIDTRVRIELLEPFLAAYWARETARVRAERPEDDAGQRLGRELTKELFEGASLAVSTNLAEPDLDLVIEVAYRNLARSPILAAWLRSSASPPPLPPELWRLPAESRIALALAGTDSGTATETFASLFSRFAQGFRSSVSPPASDTEVQSLLDAIRDLFPDRGRSVIALGPPPPGPATGARQLIGDVTTWLMLGGATDAATIRARLVRLLDAQRGDLIGEPAAVARAGQRSPAPPASAQLCAFDTAATRPPGLPEGSELWVCVPTASGAKRPAPPAASPVLLMIPGRDWSWVIVAADVPTASALAERLGRDGDSLGKRKDVVRPLSGGTPAMVGLVDLAALFDSAAKARLPDGSVARAAPPFPVRLTVKDTPEAVTLAITAALSPAARAQLKTVSYSGDRAEPAAREGTDADVHPHVQRTPDGVLAR